MKIIAQRVSQAKVTINNQLNGQIGTGLLLLVGFTTDDNATTIDKMVNKIINLRIFPDQDNHMNLSLLDINGSILSISQFTLYADCKGQNRPSFIKSLYKGEAEKLYHLFNEKLKQKAIHVEEGIFGSKMSVELTNDGPVTIILDSKEV